MSEAAATAPAFAHPDYIGNFDAIFSYHQFWIGVIIGVCVLAFDSFRRFDSFDKTSTVLVEFGAAPPSLLTTPLVYHQSLVVYGLLRIAAFSIPAALFPVMLMHDPLLLDGVLSEFLRDQTRFVEEVYGFVTTPAFPVIWAFASAGFVSLLPYVVVVEPRIRRFAQGVAFISHSVQRRLNMIHRSPLCNPREPVGVAAADAFLREVEPEDVGCAGDRHSLEKRWMRLAQILSMLDPTNRLGVNSRFIEEHSEPFRRLTEEFYSLRVRMRFNRTLTAELADAEHARERLELLDRLSKHDPDLLRDVNKVLASAEKILAAALPTSTRLNGRSSQRLRELGFEVEEVDEDMSFGLVFVSIIVGCVAGFFGSLISRAIVEALAAFPGVAYPNTNALAEATGVIVYYAAMFAAVAIGALWLGARAAGIRPDAIHPSSYFQRPLGQYVFAGAVGAALSYLAVMLVIGLTRGASAALASAPTVAIFLPVLFATNFLVQFPIYRPERPILSILREATLLALAAAVVSFITWIYFEDVLAQRAIALGETPRDQAEVIGRAIFTSLRAVFVNAAVFTAVVYMAHQLRAARRLGAEATAAAMPRGARPAGA